MGKSERTQITQIGINRIIKQGFYRDATGGQFVSMCCSAGEHLEGQEKRLP